MRGFHFLLGLLSWPVALVLSYFYGDWIIGEFMLVSIIFAYWLFANGFVIDEKTFPVSLAMALMVGSVGQCLLFVITYDKFLRKGD